MRFQCKPGCINCCDQKGFVYLSESDLARLADFTGTTKEHFERTYVYRTRNTIRFRKPPDKQCPFLRADGCGVHSVKPTQCRTFPFWPELLGDEKQLIEAARYCPGIGKGELVNVEFARREAEAMRQALPHQYK